MKLFTSPTAARGLACACIAFALAFLPACNSKDAAPPSSAAQPVEQSTEKGPVQLTVRSDRGEIAVGENLQLTIEALAETGVAVQMPKLENQIGAFEIIDAQTPPDIPDSGKRRWTHRYTLRTLEAGEQQIPAISARFIDRRNSAPDATPQENELTTQPLTIHVRSLLAGEFKPEQFRDIKSEVIVPLPWNYRPWLYSFVVAMLVSAAIAATMRAMRNRSLSQEVVVPPQPPHLWALQQLEQLASENLILRGEHREFFFRLSTIVRQYIERRFFIMAAEQTTDEFLREAQRSASLTESHRHLLHGFLRQADMVKFAKFLPQRHESEAALEAARRFVHDTVPAMTSTSPSPEFAGVAA